jgi:AraC-like DNA-binding protein
MRSFGRRGPGSSALSEQQLRIARALEGFRAGIAQPVSGLSAEVARAVADIHRHLFDRGLNVGAVRLRCGLRNNNISTHFRRELGEGIRDYIERLRLEAAVALLNAGDLEIFLVASAVGYTHQETFCRAFQRCYGCAPSALTSPAGDGARAASG